LFSQGFDGTLQKLRFISVNVRLDGTTDIRYVSTAPSIVFNVTVADLFD
jgi:hypothetical protein